MKPKGSVSLVGTGPGDAGLLTLRAAELLRQAEVLVYDSLVNPELLQLVSPAVEMIGDRRDPAQPAPSDLHALLVAKAHPGKRVVWLTGGDPARLAPEGSEVERFAAAGVTVEVVPAVPTPVVTPVGPAARPRGRPDWLASHPLFGQRVVVTRARDQAGPLTRRFQDLGAEVLELPTIKIVPPQQHEDLVDAVLGIGSYDWLVFTSANGVAMFFELFFKTFEDVRAIGGVKIAAVGPGTAAPLKALHLRVDLMPEEHLGRKIADALARYESLENLKVLLLRAEAANRDLPRALEALGAIVDDVACYRTVAETEDPAGAGARLLAAGAEWVVFTSGSTVEHFHARFDLPQVLRRFPSLRLASIGPETSKALQALGLQPAVEAKEHTLEGLVKAIERQVIASRKPGA